MALYLLVDLNGFSCSSTENSVPWITGQLSAPPGVMVKVWPLRGEGRGELAWLSFTLSSQAPDENGVSMASAAYGNEKWHAFPWLGILRMGRSARPCPPQKSLLSLLFAQLGEPWRTWFLRNRNKNEMESEGSSSSSLSPPFPLLPPPPSYFSLSFFCNLGFGKSSLPSKRDNSLPLNQRKKKVEG